MQNRNVLYFSMPGAVSVLGELGYFSQMENQLEPGENLFAPLRDMPHIVINTTARTDGRRIVPPFACTEAPFGHFK